MKKILLLFLCVVIANIAFSQNQVSKPMVLKPVYFDVSPPLRDMVKTAAPKADNSWKDGIVKNQNYVRQIQETDFVENDGITQSWFGGSNTDTTIQNWQGIGASGYLPPDTDGDVGPNHYLQVVNCSYAVYNKSGVKLIGPLANSSVFSGMPNNSNDGDAVALYDEVADRWLFSQFSLPNYPNGPFYEMIAISQTPDPTGAWYRYQYSFTDMPDYPKLGAWVDGYYMTCNRFSSGTTTYKGTGASAFDRTKMLAGDPSASMIYFTVGTTAEAYAVLCADCDGPFPPMGTPEYFMYLNDDPDRIGVYEFHADWTTPANSTYTLAYNLPVTSFSAWSGSSRNIVPQKGTSKKVDHISGRFMFRLPFRVYSDHYSIAASGTVKTSDNVAGIRWYELRKSVGTTGNWSIYQESTYQPDLNWRWMGSIALDADNNIALAYSISNTDMYPSIRYTGRLASDPLNQMTIAEGGIVNGNGSQTDASGRWGDYSALNADPSDPATFWFTTEYYTGTSSASWKTRIASFSFLNIFSVNATATPDSICFGQSSTLDAGAVGGSGTYTYSWTSLPAGFTSTIANPVVSPTVTTKYIVSVSEGVQTLTDTVQVLVANEPTAFAGNDTIIANTIPVWPLSGQATDYVSVMWTTGGDGTFINPYSLYALYTPGPNDKSSGGVNLTLHAYPIGTCTVPAADEKHVTLSWPVGIDENASNSFGMALTPNPSAGKFTVGVTGVKGQTLTISVSTLQGVNIMSNDFTSSTAVFSHDLDMTKYPRGVYVVKATAGSNSATAKMVIQ